MSWLVATLFGTILVLVAVLLVMVQDREDPSHLRQVVFTALGALPFYAAAIADLANMHAGIDLLIFGAYGIGFALIAPPKESKESKNKVVVWRLVFFVAGTVFAVWGLSKLF